MHPTTRRPRLWGFALAAGMVATLAAHGQDTPARQPVPTGQVKVDKTGALIVPLGGSVQFVPTENKLITDIFITKEDVVQVRPDNSNPKALIMSGRTAGLTQLTLTFDDRTKGVYDVTVQPDFEYLRFLIRQTVPSSNVQVVSGGGPVVILSGYVTRPEDADIIQRLATAAAGGAAGNVITAIQVGGVQQVQIDVVVATVDRNEVRERGFDFAVNGTTVNFASLVSGLVQSTGVGIPQVSPNANLQLGIVPAGFFGALRAFRSEGVAKFLAEPKVVTQSGRPAFFRAGGQQATLGPASGINGPGVQLVPFGTELEVVPIVYGNGKIWLEIAPRVSNVSQGLGIVTAFGPTPGFTEQTVRSAVMLENGQTFAIGGLIQTSVQATNSKVPVLGDLPYVGTAFSSLRHEERESEILILVTPRLVDAMDCNQVPKRLPGRETRSPDDYELFLENVLEAPRGQRKVWNGYCYNAPYKCDPSVGKYPCVGNLCGGPTPGAPFLTDYCPAPGGNCGPGGCAAPAGGVALPAYGAPAALPPAAAMPAAPQPLPGGPAAPATPDAPATTPPSAAAPADAPAALPVTALPPVADAAPAPLPVAVPALPAGPGRD